MLLRAIGPDEFDHLAATLPKDFTPLLARGPAVETPTVEQFLTKVAERSGLEPAVARTAAEALLETRAEQIAPGDTDDLMARLPIELHPVLKEARSRHPGPAKHTTLDEFLHEMAQREGTDIEHSRRHARAVLTTLREAIGDEEFFDITVQLSPEFGELWVRN